MPEDSRRSSGKEPGAVIGETIAEPQETATDAPKTAAGKKTAEPQEAGIGLTVSLPREAFTDVALENLRKLVDAKAALIKRLWR